MKYFKRINNGKLLCVGINCGGIEITQQEYETLLAEIREKASLVDQLYNSEITIEDVPTEWQEEIKRRVDERKAMEEAMETEEVSADEFYNMVEGVL